MRSTTPKLVLQGDVRKAKKWIPWATKALNRIKNLSIEGLANKVFRPVTGVAVHVWSVNNIDRIRIAVQTIGGCRNAFEELEIVNPSPFQTRFTAHHWDDTGKKVSEPGSTRWGYYIYGDGTVQTITSVGTLRDHTYPSAGEYDVTLRSMSQAFVDDGISIESFILTTVDATFTIDTTGTTKASGLLTFILDGITKADIIITIDGEPVEITTDPFSPLTSVRILFSEVSGEIMTAVVSLIAPPLGGTWLRFPNWSLVKYKCLAKTTKTITIT